MAAEHVLSLLQDSLAAEVRGSKVSVHMASPGMVATNLLLGSVKSARAAHFINVLAEDAGTVASWLVPRMRGVTGNGRYFKCDCFCVFLIHGSDPRFAGLMYGGPSHEDWFHTTKWRI